MYFTLKTKLENLLATLHNKELGTLKSLVMSKLFDGNQTHLDYLENMTAYQSSKKKQKTTTLSSKERLIMSDLCKMIEKFIVISKTLENKQQSQIILLDYYRSHENEKLFLEQYQQLSKQDKHETTNSQSYEFYSKILFEKWQFDQVKNRFSNADAENIVLYSDISFISQKLLEAVTFSTQSSLISKKTEMSLVDHLEPYILANNYLQYPCISLYYYALKLVRNQDQIEWFDLLSEGIDQFAAQFSVDEMKTLYFPIINFCIRKHNSGDKTFSIKLFEYYKKALDQKYLLTNGYLSKNTYRNINTIAIRMGHFDDAMEISRANEIYLRPSERDAALRFNLANIYYGTKRFDEASEALHDIDFDDHLSNLFAKALLLKIYYETKSERLLSSHLDAMQVYLTRKKIIGYHKTNYSNLVKYTRRLLKINPYDRTTKEKLKEKILTEKILTDKEWLLAQIG